MHQHQVPVLVWVQYPNATASTTPGDVNGGISGSGDIFPM